MRTQKQIRNKLESLRAKIRRLYDEIVILRKECPHTNTTVVYKSDTGNYCKQDDRYWIEHTCQGCEEYWETEQ